MIEEYDKNTELYKKFTQPEELIQSNNSEIISKMNEITSGTDDPHEKVSRIYDFMINHLTYLAQDEEMGAVWALENQVGDCSEYSYLFVALCRAAGIPAKIKAGFAFHSVDETLQDGHMWAEYYLENYGWIPVDATWHQFDEMDYLHFSSIQSVPEVMPYSNYVFNSTTMRRSEEKQILELNSCPASTFADKLFAEKTINAAQTIEEAKFAVFAGSIFGVSLFFPSETERTCQTLDRSLLLLCDAITLWEAQPDLARLKADEALENAEEASQGAWTCIAYLFVSIIGILIALLLVILFFSKRH